MIQIVRREINRILARPLYLFGLVIAPLFCFFFFTTLMEKGLPTGLPIAVVDMDDTPMSRTLTRQLDAFSQTDVVLRTVDFGYARRQMQQGKVYGIFYIPDGLTNDATSGRQPRISFYMNHSYLIAGSLVFKDMRTMSVLASGAAGRATRRAKGETESYIMGQLQPIVIDTHPISNPWLNYSVYLNNMLLPAIIQLLVLLMTVYAIGSEMKEGTADEWLSISKGSMFRALVGKLTPYFISFVLMGLFCLTLLYHYLEFPLSGSFWTMALAMVMLIASSMSLAILFVVILPIFRLALSAASLIGVLSVSITGFSFPVFAMHPLLQKAALAFPLRHYFLVYVDVALRGTPIYYILDHFVFFSVLIILPLLALPRLENMMLNHEYKM